MTARRVQSDIRGRVILRVESGVASSVVVETAVRVARTFNGELHGLFVENENLLSLARLPFAREISFSGRQWRTLSAETMQQELALAAETMRRRIDRLAQAAQLPFRFEVAGREQEDGGRRQRELSGILALGDPLLAAMPADPAQIFAETTELAGILLAGADARRTTGPVLVIVDPQSDIGYLVDTAARIARQAGEPLVVAICDASDAESRHMRARVRDALGPERTCEFVHAAIIGPTALARMARRHRPGLVVARSGLIGSRQAAARYVSALECPILLLR